MAVLPVVLYHAFPGGLNAGFLGVDVFFVISGYLITKIIHSEISRGDFSIWRFYARRIRRIFPALILVLLATSIFGFLFLFPKELEELGKHVFAGTVFISNFVLWSEIGYFDSSAWEKVLLHLWSLAVEEQFYILWPFVLIFAFNRLRRPIILVSGLFISSLGIYLVLYKIEPSAAFYFSPSRFWELLAGAFIALFARPPELKALPANTYSFFAAFVLLAAFAAADEEDPSMPFVTLAVVLASTFLIWIGPLSWFNRNVLSNRILVAVGLISYPLYLWHWPILAYIRIGQDGSIHISYAIGSVAIVTAILLAWLTYRFVEKGIRFNSNSLVVPGLSASVAVLGLIGLTTNFSDGIPSRVSVNPPSGMVLFQDYPHPQQDGSCENHFAELNDFWACVVNNPVDADIILIGDSHANQYYLSFKELADTKTILNLSEPGCLPFNSFDSESCHKKQQRTLNFLSQQKDGTNVVLTGYFSFLSAAGFRNGNLEGHRVARDLSPETKARFIENGRWFLDELSKHDLNVYLLTDIPDLVERPAACLDVDGYLIDNLRVPNGQNLIQQGSDCIIDVADFNSRSAQFKLTLDQMLSDYPDIQVFEASNELCDINACYAVKDGVPLYWNSDHLTVTGGNMVIQALLQAYPNLKSD